MDWNNKEQVLKAVEKNGKALENASKELRNDKEVVLKAVLNSQWALEYASEELRNDKEVVLAAIRQRGKIEFGRWSRFIRMGKRRIKK